MSPDKSLKPTTLRLLLASSLLLIAGLSIAGFIYSYKELSNYAVEVSHAKADDVASSNSLQTLQNIQTELKKNQQAITRLGSLTDTDVLPQFKAIENVKAYAARNHLTLQSIDFDSSSGTTPASTTQTTAPTTQTPVQSSGAQTVDVIISFGGEVNYTNFLQFLSDIQHNIPKMQVQGIDISEGSNPTMVKSGPLTIHMYTN